MHFSCILLTNSDNVPFFCVDLILCFRALEILKSESVQLMMMMSSMSPFQKKNIISPVTKTNDNWQSYNFF